MKIDLNLSIAQSFRQRYLLAWAAPVTLLALVILVKLAVAARADYREYRSVRQSVLKEQSQENQLRNREAALRRGLERPEYKQVMREVEFVNSLIERKQLSLTELTAKITSLLPPQVRLTTLALPDSTGDPLVRLGIEGGSEEQVESFLSNLEDSPDFKEVTVIDQGFEEKGSKAAPVTITCTARYVGGQPQRGG